MNGPLDGRSAGFSVFFWPSKVQFLEFVHSLRNMQNQHTNRAERTFFYKWIIKYNVTLSNGLQNEASEFENFTRAWEAAGLEMDSSLILIRQLKERLSNEFKQRTSDLNWTKSAIAFMKLERDALAFAMRLSQRQIEALQRFVAKSAMRFFVHVKPVHERVILDVPGALARYNQKKVEERAKLLETKISTAKIPLLQPTPTPPLPNHKTRDVKLCSLSESNAQSIKTQISNPRRTGYPSILITNRIPYNCYIVQFE
jgi:hypothetical protein